MALYDFKSLLSHLSFDLWQKRYFLFHYTKAERKRSYYKLRILTRYKTWLLDYNYLWMTKSLPNVSNKYLSQACICVTSNVINKDMPWTLLNCYRLTVQVFKNHHCNPFQSSSHYFFLFHVPFFPSFNGLSSYFYVSLKQTT